MALRMASHSKSSDCDNPVNIRSTRFNRRSLRPLSIAAMVLVSAIAFSSISLVRSFPVRPSSATGKNTLAKQQKHQGQQQPQRHLSSSLGFTITQQQQKVRHLLRTEIRAATNDDSLEKDDAVTLSDGAFTGEKENTAAKAAQSATIDSTTTTIKGGPDDGYDGLGEYDPSENLPQTERAVPNVGDPQLRVKEKDWSVTNILKELAAIQQQGPQKYCILGTRHCSYLHQQIIELLAYALVLSGNHVYTSGAPGTNAAAVRGALRAEREDLLTVVLPQSLEKQTKESQELLEKVDDLITMPQNDDMALDVASRICNSYLLSLTDQLVSFAFHESTTVIEANKEAKALDMLVTTLYLD